MKTAILVALAAATVMPADAQTAPPVVTYIQAGTLLDRPGQAPRGATTIIVRDGKIVALRDGFVAPEAGATLVDLRTAFVMPGMVDMHVHLWGIGGDPMRARLEAMTRDRFDDEMTAVANARQTLAAGFTSVRDLGGDPRGIRALRDAIDAGAIEGPSITNAGEMISVTGGHGDGGNGLAEEFADMVHGREVNVCNGPDDCRRAVRAQVALGARVIKFAATGGVLSNVSGGLGRAMTPDEMRAIIDTAHMLGRKVAAHSHATEGTRAALEAGVGSIEHGTFLDDETIRLFKAKGAYLVPTEIAPVAALAQARGGALPAATIVKAESAAAAMAASHRRAYAAGVKVAFGTDTGVSKHGDNATEFALLVQNGLTPAQAIAAATSGAADLLGRDDIGTLAPGKTADIIAVRGSPLDDVNRLTHVDFVMHRGVVAKAVAAK
ncbi:MULTISPECIES: metal-dependent hydrolase family protein [Sphingomonas]|uniref:metal-dependent hydrolase family protein n=1 Tax=Sphingomonas TaxID=13687 RepID=UPI00141AD49E|nr:MULTISPECIES: amidohydrolase family protein [Sphingomonas]MBD8734011.1 amidohydrolase family protein [Sphingomonas sp. CFBP 13706]NII59752.1 imidazolonepropionase-like amidohydrolase [Sphingomonas aerolata]